MILPGSGVTAVRGTHPPDLPVPAFWVHANGADSRTAATTVVTILRILIDAPPRRFGLGPGQRRERVRTKATTSRISSSRSCAFQAGMAAFLPTAAPPFWMT